MQRLESLQCTLKTWDHAVDHIFDPVELFCSYNTLNFEFEEHLKL
jgi:hypothetical protein